MLIRFPAVVLQSIVFAPGRNSGECLNLVIKTSGDRGGVRITDSHFGHASGANLGSLEAGWTAPFRDGLKQFMEKGVRRD